MFIAFVGTAVLAFVYGIAWHNQPSRKRAPGLKQDRTEPRRRGGLRP